jgi:hypothetical protein
VPVEVVAVAALSPSQPLQTKLPRDPFHAAQLTAARNASSADVLSRGSEAGTGENTVASVPDVELPSGISEKYPLWWTAGGGGGIRYRELDEEDIHLDEEDLEQEESTVWADRGAAS